MLVDSSPLAITRSNTEQLDKTQGNVLNPLCRSMAAGVKTYPRSDAKKRKLHDIRIRRVALQALLEDRHDERRRTQIIEDVANIKNAMASVSESANTLPQRTKEQLRVSRWRNARGDRNNHDL